MCSRADEEEDGEKEIERFVQLLSSLLSSLKATRGDESYRRSDAIEIKLDQTRRRTFSLGTTAEPELRNEAPSRLLSSVF